MKKLNPNSKFNNHKIPKEAGELYTFTPDGQLYKIGSTLGCESHEDLHNTIKQLTTANKSLMKELKRMIFKHERLISASQNQKFLNVICEDDSKYIKQIDTVATVIADQKVPVDVENRCYYVSKTGRILLDKIKLAAVTEVF